MFNFIRYELKYYFKNKSEAIYLYSYYISILVLVPFTVSPEVMAQSNFATLALWVALASAVAIGAQGLFRRDREQGLLEYYQLLPTPLELIVAAKWAAFFIFIMLPLLAAMPFAALWMNLSVTHLWHHAIGLTAGAAGLTILSTLLAALLAGIEKAGALLSLLILPLSIPILIFGADYCRSSTNVSSGNLLLILGFTAFMVPIMCWAGASAIRNSN